MVSIVLDKIGFPNLSSLLKQLNRLNQSLRTLEPLNDDQITNQHIAPLDFMASVNTQLKQQNLDIELTVKKDIGTALKSISDAETQANKLLSRKSDFEIAEETLGVCA